MVDGADGIELDVRTARDGTVVVVHDLDLARVTSGRDVRKVAQLSTGELSLVELDAGGRVPSLADVLDWADVRGALVNVELKHDTSDRALLARQVARLLRGRAHVAQRVMLSSFEPELLMRCAALCPSVPRAFLFHDKQRFVRTPVVTWIGRAVSAIALHPERTLCDPARVEAWRRSGALINVWTVNDPREANDLGRLDVDGLITDDPAALVAAGR